MPRPEPVQVEDAVRSRRGGPRAERGRRRPRHDPAGRPGAVDRRERPGFRELPARRRARQGLQGPGDLDGRRRADAGDTVQALGDHAGHVPARHGRLARAGPPQAGHGRPPPAGVRHFHRRFEGAGVPLGRDGLRGEAHPVQGSAGCHAGQAATLPGAAAQEPAGGHEGRCGAARVPGPDRGKRDQGHGGEERREAARGAGGKPLRLRGAGGWLPRDRWAPNAAACSRRRPRSGRCSC